MTDTRDADETPPPSPRRQALDAQAELTRALGLFVRTHYRDFGELLALIEASDGTPPRLAFLEALVGAGMEHATSEATRPGEVTDAYETAEGAAFTARAIRLAIVRHRMSIEDAALAGGRPQTTPDPETAP